MVHFAKLDFSTTDIAVTEAPDSEDGKELELSNKTNQTYRQSYPDRSKRKNPANIGFTYDKDRDAFIQPKPYSSWTLNETSCEWEAPTARPTDGNLYDWDETSKQWKPH